MEEQQDYKVTHEFFIAGVQFHGLKNVVNDLSEGDHLLLTPEPSNKFDPNAVRIEWLEENYDSTMLGFVPKKFSSEVAAALEVGKDLQCVLVKLNKSAKQWEMAKVEIREMVEVEVDEVISQRHVNPRKVFHESFGKEVEDSWASGTVQGMPQDEDTIL